MQFENKNILVSVSSPDLQELISNAHAEDFPEFSILDVLDLEASPTSGNLFHKGVLWIMDFQSFVMISGVYGGILPTENKIPMLLLMAEYEWENLNEIDIPHNVTLVSVPFKQVYLQWCIRQSLKGFSKSQESIPPDDKYRKLFFNSTQARIIADAQSLQIKEANKAAEGLYKKDAQELLKCSFDQLHPQFSETIFSELERIPQEGSAPINLKYYTPEGEVYDFELTFHYIWENDNKTLSISINDITEKEKADQQTYQQSEMLRNTLESIDDLFFSLNMEGDFVEYYQPAGGSHLSLSSDVFIGKNIYDVGFPLDVAQRYLKTIEQVIEEDEPQQMDYYLEAFGSRLWYRATISPRKSFFGTNEGVTVLCRDVTKEKKTEEALKRARDFYLTLLADFPTMIWKTNTSKRADYFNKTWLEFTGNSLEEELRKDWSEKLYPADVANVLSVLQQAIKNKSAFQIEHRLRHRNGQYRWVLNAGRPFYNLEGQFAGFIGSCYDITERRKAEEMLNLQKRAMESALEGILIIKDDNENYPVIYANKELENLTRLHSNQIIGEKFINVLGCPLSSDIENSLLTSLKDKNSFKGEIHCRKTSDRPETWRLLYMAPVADKRNSTNHFVAVLSDITETKQVEKTLREKNRQLRKTNEELDRFVYSTSHELRSPLMSVLGLLNIMEAEDKSGEQSAYLEMIRDSISRLDKIIHDIIDYSRNARVEIMHEKIDFVDMIREIIQNHRYVDGFDKVDFRVDVASGAPFLSDKNRIRIIFNNFISNSLRFHNFNQKEPFIDISVKTTPVNTKIVISDNGTGIHEKHLPKLYEMFYRGTEKSKGSGIGLYIVKEIVEKLKGKITVQSEVNAGTSFIVEIPNYLSQNYKVLSFNSEEQTS